jgi:hypothetical protein
LDQKNASHAFFLTKKHFVNFFFANVVVLFFWFIFYLFSLI